MTVETVPFEEFMDRYGNATPFGRDALLVMIMDSKARGEDFAINFADGRVVVPNATIGEKNVRKETPIGGGNGNASPFGVSRRVAGRRT
jgi:hypothetical protein